MDYKKLIEQYPDDDPKILKTYTDADEYVVLNIDQALHPVYIKLPQPPPLHEIDGFGLPAKDQKFTYQVFPKKLQKLVDSCETIDKIWDVLENNQREYHKEIEWIRKQWELRDGGYWFFCNGKPTNLVWWHHIYLNFWRFKTGERPQYRDKNRKFYHGMYYAYTTCETPCYDSQGKLIYEDVERRILKMRDTGLRTMLGISHPKERKEGASSMCLCAEYMEVITHTGVVGGIISMTGDHAKDKMFDDIIVPGWAQMPFFFKPRTTSNQNPDKEINFNASRQRADKIRKVELGSSISYSPTSLSTLYDGGNNIWINVDESGKCFGLNTPIRMYDGSVKMVQNIKEGDLVMGNDSTPRFAHGITIGQEEMYEVVPNKGKPFTCNESHVLSCIFIDRPFKWKKGSVIGDTINITVKEFLELNASQKKKLGLYRTGWEYEEKLHDIDPYFLGVWLGDGHSGSCSITNEDSEIIEWLRIYSETNGLFLDIKGEGQITYRITSRKIGGNKFTNSSKNKIWEGLKNLNVINNKHIPVSYLRDNRKNRLQLLAGLIDTDGHVCKNPSTKGTHRSVEIIQKNDQIAKGIIELATSLGFYTSNNQKIATMRRKDGSLYMCLVSRVQIYGDIDVIPTKVKHKKAVVSRTKNRRNPLKSGFTIISKGEGTYYGFAVDKNHLFLLEDGTVVHNTQIDVFLRHKQLKPCVSLGNGANIFGFLTYPSTVGEMTGIGAPKFFKVCQDSHFEKRDISGQTKSGMMIIYFPACEGLEGFIGPYGESIIETPTPEQAAFIGKNYGAKEYLINKREQLTRDGDIEGYNEEIRLFPMKYMECFRTEDGEIGFNTQILNDRIDEITIIEKSICRFGNFRWKHDKRDTEVYLDENVDIKKAHWCLTTYLNPDQTNRYIIRSVLLNGEKQDQRFPIEPKYTSCADAFQFGKPKGTRLSLGGGAVFRDYDAIVDSGKNISDWITHDFVATYLHRPLKQDDYLEEMLMADIYFGSMQFPENNIKDVWRYYEARGYAGYLRYEDDIKSGITKSTPGFDSLGDSKQRLFNKTRDYIQDHGHRVKHLKLLLQWKEIEDMSQMTDYDLLAAAGGCLLGTPQLMHLLRPEKKEEEKKSTLVYPMMSYGNK